MRTTLTRAQTFLSGLLLALLVAVALGAAPKLEKPLPPLGATLRPLPAGAGKTQTESACVACHSTDMLLQQKMNEKQWTATVEKMTRWGADVSEKDKPVIIEYLAKHFGPGNHFTPVPARPAK